MHTAEKLFLALFYSALRKGLTLLILIPCIEAMNLLPPELLAFMKTDDGDQEALPAPSKRPKREPLCDATNRFGYLVTGTNTLATFSMGLYLITPS